MAARILAGALAGAGATVVLNDAYPDAIPSLGLSRPKDIKLTYFDIAGVADKVRIAMHRLPDPPERSTGTETTGTCAIDLTRSCLTRPALTTASASRS